jgi:hypothetical protein
LQLTTLLRLGRSKPRRPRQILKAERNMGRIFE